MCDDRNATVVPTPEWFWSERHYPEKGIAIDSCIADDVQRAWAEGVRTLGSCCGHGKTPPSLVLTDDPDQPKIARLHLPGWTLLQWRLNDVTTSGLTEDERAEVEDARRRVELARDWSVPLHRTAALVAGVDRLEPPSD